MAQNRKDRTGWSHSSGVYRRFTLVHFAYALVLSIPAALMLLALLRWRRPEARWLAATACVPGTPGPQEALVFFVWPLSFRQLLVLGLLSHGALWAAFFARQRGDFYSYVDVAAVANIAFIYLPALVVILRRPNEGSVPRVLDRHGGR